MQIKELKYGASCMKFLCNQVSTLFKMLPFYEHMHFKPALLMHKSFTFLLIFYGHTLQLC